MTPAAETIEDDAQSDVIGASVLDKVLDATSKARFSMTDIEKMAGKAASSRMFVVGGGEEGTGSTMTPDQAFMLMMIAEATGDHPVMALLRWDVVMGRPAMKSSYVLAQFQAKGGSVEWTKTTDTEVEAIFTCKRHPKPFKIAITLQELMDRKVAVKYNKERKAWETKHMYKNHPRSMLRWRAVSEAVRAIDPGILMGMYTDVEADEITPPGAGPAEQAAHDSLVSHLKGRLEKPAATVEAVTSQGEVTSEAAANPPLSDVMSEGREWVEDALQDYHAELAKVAEQHPGEAKLRERISSFQVANHVLKEAVAAGHVIETDLKGENGKRDKARAAAEFTRLWEEQAAWVMDCVGQYLAQSMSRLMAPMAQGEQAALPI